ncbi:DNA polymerase Y family protein [Sphingomonas hankyongi]|uniref:DNA polymerase Y family protein n=1 Tax=Sphingomonas hankyongi TaxID=2908209 RepID=A0ABT0S5C2_9SPHN|nr:DNA polymerase Y family protein [Sphingomonas hankyongi]MCL6730806.1 DNA polymerase Y family protein [Sphingomonas hankyongi]
MKRVLSIWLPGLAIERWAKTSDCPPDTPVVLTVEGTHGPVIHAVTRAARERGARPGARLTDARALDPALVALPADPDGDAALLRRLAKWAERWSPLVELDGDDSLRLDVTGAAHLFGGESAMVQDIRSRFAGLGLTARISIAPTAAAAWALGHYAPAICREGEIGAKLGPLPVAALRLPDEAVRTLERLGLKSIETLAGIERRALARRFREADNPVDALDRALGRRAEPLTAAPPNPPPRALLRLEEPATHPEAPIQALDRLIPKLVRELQQRHLGARRLSLTGYRVDGSIAVASVATAIASREPKHLARLLADKAAALNPEFGFDAFALTADWTEDLGAAQDSLVEEPGGSRELARLVDRLTVKLGSHRVRRPQPAESHLPERANRWISALAKAEPIEPQTVRRPQRLLDRPEAIDVIYATPEGLPRRFVWRRAVHDIARAEGPERIAPEWWRQPSSARLRDYYRVEDTSGRRYWIYREGLAGDGRGGAPNWFIHGLFG